MQKQLEADKTSKEYPKSYFTDDPDNDFSKDDPRFDELMKKYF